MKIKNFFILLIIFLLFIIFFANVEIVSTSITSSLKFCVNSLIPSLFPYMILTGIITQTDCVDWIFANISDRIFQKLGVCKKYIISVVLGCICGFVVGAKAISEIYKKNGTLGDGYSDAVILSSNAGIGFVVACVGVKIWGNIYFGIFLYLVQIFSAFILHMIFKEKLQVSNLNIRLSTKKKSFLSAISFSINSACVTILSIIAFVVFYSLLMDVFSHIFNISKDASLYKVIYSLLEFSKGSFSAVIEENISICAFLSGFTIGFGGICIYSQIIFVCEDLPFNKKKYIFIKLLQGIICGISCLIFAKIKNISISNKEISAFSYNKVKFIPVILTILMIFIFFYIIKKKFSKKY